MKHLVLIGVAFLAIVAGIVLARIRVNTSKSVSYHIAQSHVTVWLARVAIPLVSAMMLLWYFGWYFDLRGGSIAQALLMSCVAILAALAGIIPYYKGRIEGRLHDIFSWTYVYILPFAVGSFYFTEPSLTGKAVITAMFLWQVLVLLLYKFYKPARAYFLYFQISYIAAFGLTLLSVTYIGG